MTKLKVGIIGVQGFGRRHAELLSDIAGVTVQAACECAQ